MNKFIDAAIKQAQKAFEQGEIPVGAVVVKDGKILSKGFNMREKTQNATKHAEISAIEKACKKLGSWRLDGCDIYVSLEPCPMCAGAIANARIKNLFYACKENTSNDNLLQTILASSRLNHKVCFEMIEDKRAGKLLSDFFKDKRKIKG